MIKKNRPLLNRCFEILKGMSADKNLSVKKRLTAIGVLSESAVYEYKNCDSIVNVAYSELLSIIEDDNVDLVLRVEAIVLMLMLFKNFASVLPKDKADIQDDIYHLCFKKIQYFLEHEQHDIEGWLSSIDFLIAFQTDFSDCVKHENIFKNFNQQLIDIAHDKNQTIKNRIFSVNLLFDAMYKYRFEKYSKDDFKNFHQKHSHCEPQFYNEISACFDLLYQMASDTALEPLSRISAIEAILEFIYFEKDVLEKMHEGCFELLVEFTSHSIESEVLLKASMLLFGLTTDVMMKASMLVFNECKDYQQIPKKCMQNISVILKNKNEKMDVRVKAIQFVLYGDQDVLSQFTDEELLTDTVCRSLVDIVLSGESYTEGYLQAIRLYFHSMYRHEEPPPDEKPTPAIKIGRNDPCFCGSTQKYKKCCYKKNDTSELHKKISDYNQAIALDPHCPGHFYNRGRSKYLLGDYSQAIEDYDQAILLKPNYSNAFNNRGLSKKALGLYQEAVLDFDQAIALEPNNIRAFSNRGAVQYDLGQYELAMKDFEEALRWDPNDVKVLTARKLTEFMLSTEEMTL